MTNKPRDWPNVAKEVRDRSAEAAVEGIRVLEPLVVGNVKVSEAEQIRRTAIGLIKFQQIARLLESAGACTRP